MNSSPLKNVEEQTQIKSMQNQLNKEAASYKPFIQLISEGVGTSSQQSQNIPIIEPEVLQRIKTLQVAERKIWQGVNAHYCGIPGTTSLDSNERIKMFQYERDYNEASERVFDILRELYDCICNPMEQPSKKNRVQDVIEKREDSYAYSNSHMIRFKFQEQLRGYFNQQQAGSVLTSDMIELYSEQMIQKINTINFGANAKSIMSIEQISHSNVMHPSGVSLINSLSNKYCFYKMLKCDSKLVRFIFDLNGLIPTDRHDWNLLWTNSQGSGNQSKKNNGQHTSYFFERLNPYTQRINHFPGSNEITRKDKMAINIKKMQFKYSHEYFNFIPETFTLPEEFQQFEFAFIRRQNQYNRADYSGGQASIYANQSDQRRNLWIVKPSSSSRGRGIYIINSPKQIPRGTNDSLVVSRYIETPLLLYGHKFDLRIYVVVTCYDPLRIYVYREGLVRFASEKYDLSKACAGAPQEFNGSANRVEQTNGFSQQLSAAEQASKYSHLTNYSINKKNDKYVQNENAEEDDSGFKWSLNALNEQFEAQGIDVNLMWSKIYDVIVKSLLSVEEVIKDKFKKASVHRSNCYELFGYDVLLDSNLNPWLLEVNLSPSLAFESPLDLKIKGNLLKDIFNLIGVNKPSKPQSQQKNKSQKPEQINPQISKMAGYTAYKSKFSNAYYSVGSRVGGSPSDQAQQAFQQTVEYQQQFASQAARIFEGTMFSQNQ